MAKALIQFNDGTMKVVEPKTAVEAYKALTGETEPTEAQEAFLLCIKRIFIPPSHRHEVDGYKAIDSPYDGDRTKHGVVFKPLDDPKEPPKPEDKLYHEGRLQGMSQAVPTGDQ